MVFDIDVATHDHISDILYIEKTIESGYPATRQTLADRLDMFPDGFLIIKKNHQIIGYIETCIWYVQSFSTYLDICEFSKLHHLNGTILFVIFIGVDERFQKMGVGTLLLNELKIRIKRKYPHIKKIHLVSKEQYVNTFYKKNNFHQIKRLPDYMPGYSGMLMEYQYGVHPTDGRRIVQKQK